jgi:tripartite-type tricarboxylate transporter receptor subunit TctC
MHNLAAVTIAVVLSVVGAGAASAQDFPTRPITIIVPSTPGGITDASTRVVAKVLAEKLGQPVIVDNKPGAGGIVAAEYVAAAKPDGYTLLLGTSGPMATYTSLYKKLSYDPLTSFAPVLVVLESPMIMVVNENRPYTTFQDFIAYAKSHPGKINFGSAGTGTGTHLVGEMLKQAAGIDMTHVPYKGSVPELADLLSGVLDVMFDYAIALQPQIGAGKLRSLAVTSSKRLQALPDVPTIAESGYPGVNFTAWSSIVAPAATPPAIVARLADAFEAALHDPVVVKYFDDNGLSPMHGLREDRFRSFIVSETAKIRQLIEKSNITPE